MKHKIEKLKNIGEILLDHSKNINDLSLFDGSSGTIFCLFHLSKFLKEERYRNAAENLLDLLYNKIENTMSLNFGYGLTGIGWTIDYLVKEHFIENIEPDDILEELDDKIFREVNFLLPDPQKNMETLIGISFYLTKRIQNSKNEEIVELAKDLLILILNKITEIIIDRETFKEPPSFNLLWILPIYLYLISEIGRLNFYNYKLNRIFYEITPVVQSMIPLNHGNRFFLLLAMERLCEVLSCQSWESHCQLLRNNINLDKIFVTELRNKNINIMNGAGGIQVLLSVFSSSIYIKENKELLVDYIYDKIAHSAYWEDIDYVNGLKPKNILHGLSGIALVLIQNIYYDEI